MHRVLYWRTSEGLQLDAGEFLAGLEQAAGTEADVVGKPAPHSSLPRWLSGWLRIFGTGYCGVSALVGLLSAGFRRRTFGIKSA